jgi:uncharacterized protein (TIGR03086 family)
MPVASTVTDDVDMAADDTAIAVTQLIAAGRDREAALLATGGTTMDPLSQLDRLGPALGGVVGNITAEQLDDPTPCATFTVRGILEHMIGGATAFAAAYRGVEPAEPDLSDPLANFGPALGDLLAAAAEPGALDRVVAAPFGEVSGETFARFVAFDGLVHGWDMAVATGQPYSPPDEVVAAADSFARSMIDPLRDGTTFAAATEPPAGATPIERLVAFTGRTVPTAAA